jgi:hypothetical protein
LEQQLLEVIAALQTRKIRLGHPEIPLIPRHHVASIRKRQVPARIEVTANVVRMPVSQDHSVDGFRVNAFAQQVLDQSSRCWRELAGSCFQACADSP